jgi:SAM-dependent methyltransferase
MTKRRTRNYVHKLLEDNPDWNVLDTGCGSDGFLRANVYADITDQSDAYKDKRFVQTPADDTPFEDKEFDFVIATHVAEHVPDPVKFLAELVRISKRGYIEVPTPFFDNAASGNDNPPPHGHLWWVTFNDDEEYIDFKPRQKILSNPFLEAIDTTFLVPFFGDQMVTGIYWENEIRAKVSRPIFSYNAGDSAPEIILNYQDSKPPVVWTPIINMVDYLINIGIENNPNPEGQSSVYGSRTVDNNGYPIYKFSDDNLMHLGKWFATTAIQSRREVAIQMNNRRHEAQLRQNKE